MNRNKSFNNFLDQLHEENPALIESVKSGFKVWCEGYDSMDYDAYLDRRVQEYYGDDDDGSEEAMEKLEEAIKNKRFLNRLFFYVLYLSSLSSWALEVWDLIFLLYSLKTLW